MELLTFTFAANETKRFERAGRYVEIIDAPFALSLYLSDAAGARVNYALNALAGLYLEGAYSAIEMSNGSTAQTITLLVAEGRGGSRRQPGTVQIVDGGRARSLANVAGVGGGTVAASVGNFAYMQLWNPAASGRRVVCKKVAFSSSTAGDFAVRTHNAALANLQGSPVSKLNQNILNQFEVRDGVSVGLTGQGLYRVLVQANALQIFAFEEPLVLEPGFSVIAGANQVNRDAAVVFEFYHESMV